MKRDKEKKNEKKKERKERKKDRKKERKREREKERKREREKERKRERERKGNVQTIYFYGGMKSRTVEARISIHSVKSNTENRTQGVYIALHIISIATSKPTTLSPSLPLPPPSTHHIRSAESKLACFDVGSKNSHSLLHLQTQTSGTHPVRHYCPRRALQLCELPCGLDHAINNIYNLVET